MEELYLITIIGSAVVVCLFYARWISKRVRRIESIIIERRKKAEGWCEVGKDTADEYYARGFRFACNDLLAFVDTFQQEQQKPNLENEIKDYTETLYHETFGNGQGTLDEFDWEDIVQVIDDTARYFYNLNKNDA